MGLLSNIWKDQEGERESTRGRESAGSYVQNQRKKAIALRRKRECESKKKKKKGREEGMEQVWCWL